MLKTRAKWVNSPFLSCVLFVISFYLVLFWYRPDSTGCCRVGRWTPIGGGRNQLRLLIFQAPFCNADRRPPESDSVSSVAARQHSAERRVFLRSAFLALSEFRQGFLELRSRPSRSPKNKFGAKKTLHQVIGWCWHCLASSLRYTATMLVWIERRGSVFQLHKTAWFEEKA